MRFANTFLKKALQFITKLCPFKINIYHVRIMS